MRRELIAGAALPLVVLAGCGDGQAPTVSAPSTVASTSGTQDSSPSSEATESTAASNSSTTNEAPASTPAAASSSAPAHDVSSIISDMRTSVDGATTTHLILDLEDDGRPVTMDMRGRVDGSNQLVRMDAGSQGKADVLFADGKTYLKGNRTFWEKQERSSPTATRLLTGKYAPVPQKEAQNFTSRSSIKSLLSLMSSDPSLREMNSSNTSVRSIQHNGAAALQLTCAQEGIVLVVSADAKRWPLDLKQKDDGEINKARFAEWDRVPKYSPPASSEIVNVPGSSA
ncbi:hypothetical protein ACMYYO_00820 [Dermacoccaceae bacterium W4C1]